MRIRTALSIGLIAMLLVASSLSAGAASFTLNFEREYRFSGVAGDRLWDWEAASDGAGDGLISDSERAAGVADLNKTVSAMDEDGVGGVDGPNNNSWVPQYQGTKVGDLWKGLGITITGGTGVSYITGTLTNTTLTNKLMLLDSHDPYLNNGLNGANRGTGVLQIPYTNAGGGTTDGNGSQGDGDTDMLTGNDLTVAAMKAKKDAPNNNHLPFPGTALALGNLLIFEEFTGDGIPDDLGSGGGVMRFEVDDEVGGVTARIDRFRFVDDVEGQLAIWFTDGSRLTFGVNNGQVGINGTISGFGFDGALDNTIFDVNVAALMSTHDTNFGTSFSNKAVDFFTVQFNGSGGLGEISFSDLTPVVPEPSTALVALVFSVWFATSRQRRLA